MRKNYRSSILLHRRKNLTKQPFYLDYASAFSCLIGLRIVFSFMDLQAEKSNEITAIPLLLKLLSLKNNIITIDAMGTQKVIAKQIHDEGGFYVLALKDNQGTLNDDVRLFLESELKKTHHHRT